MSFRTYAFIDASNLFYGGIKRLGWKIDYEKLAKYLTKKYQVEKLFYYSGVEAHGYEVELNSTERYPIEQLLEYLTNISDEESSFLKKDIARTKFLAKIETFGYILRLKAIKHIKSYDGSIKTKANCDVDLTFDLVRLIKQYDQALILSGDGDFETLIRYLKDQNKMVKIIANTQNTAREIKFKYGKDFIDFSRIQDLIVSKK